MISVSSLVFPSVKVELTKYGDTLDADSHIKGSNFYLQRSHLKKSKIFKRYGGIQLLGSIKMQNMGTGGGGVSHQCKQSHINVYN